MALTGLKNVVIQKISTKCVILAASIIGILQALTWIALSLIAILYYTAIIERDALSSEDYGYWIYSIYLEPLGISNGEFFIDPQSFNIFMYFYLVLSFIWLIISLCLLWAMVRDKWDYVKGSMAIWSAITFSLAVLDIILMSLIAADLKKATDLFNDLDASAPTSITSTSSSFTEDFTEGFTEDFTEGFTEDSSLTTILSTTIYGTTELLNQNSFTITDHYLRPEIELGTNYLLTNNGDYKKTITTSMSIVMTAAARGYILWIVNVVFASILVALAYAKQKQDERSMLPIIDAYATGQRPFNLYESTDIGSGNWNNGFQPDESIIFSPSRNPLGNVESTPDIFRPADLYRPNDQLPSAEMYGPIRPDSVPTRPNNFPTRPNNFYSKPDSFPRPIEVVSGGPRLAKIGKSALGRRTPPQNAPVPPQTPYIPPPDYTPPGSPSSKPRSVLRPKSNYVL